MIKAIPKINLILLVVCVMWLASCAPDPRKQAEAFAIQEAAKQDSANQTQTRLHAEQEHQIVLEALKVEQGHREATAREWRAGLNQLIHYGFITLTIGACAFCLAFAYSASNTSIGLSRAAVQAANVRANLIYMDERTRQYPLLLHYVGHGQYLLANANLDGALMLDSRNEADRQMIAISGAVQVAGMIGREARLSKDPAAISIIRPTVINSEVDHE